MVSERHRYAAAASLLAALLWPLSVAAERPDDDDDDVVIIDDDSGDDKNASDAKLASSSSSARTMFMGTFDSRAALDLVWDGDGEDVFVLRNRLELTLAHEPSPWMKLQAGGWFTHRVMVGSTAGDEVRAVIDPQLGETYALWRFDVGLDVAIGHRIFRWGRTDFQRPLDVINPMDLRTDPLETRHSRQLPVWSVELSQRAGPLQIAVLWVPFFREHAVDWLGTDWAILQPALRELLPPGLRNVIDAVDASRYEEFQEAFSTTQDPPDDGLTGSDVGLRVTGNFGGVDVGLAYAFQWDRIPVIRFDDTFASALKATLDSGGDTSSDLKKAYASEYLRRHVVGADFNFTVGPVGFKGDVAYSSSRTFYTSELKPLRKPSLHYALQVDFFYNYILDVQLEFAHLLVFGLESDIELAVRDEAMTLSGAVTMRLGLELMVSVLTQWVISHGDVMFTPRFIWRVSELLTLEAGIGIFVGGEAGAQTRTLGALSANADYVYLNSVLSF